jgi:hypothetical protein
MPPLVGVLERRGARRSRGTFAEALLAVPPSGAGPPAAADIIGAAALVPTPLQGEPCLAADDLRTGTGFGNSFGASLGNIGARR